MRIYAHDFDREALKVDNYILFLALLFKREHYFDLSGFDSFFDLFEDWDFLLRLAQKGDFLRIPKVTCEIRHFEGGTSAVLAAPEGSDEFRAAKLRVWEKHGVDAATFARVYEKQKRRMQTTYADAVRIRGEAGDVRRDMAALSARRRRSSRRMPKRRTRSTGTRCACASSRAGSTRPRDRSRLQHKTLQLERLTRDLEARAAENDQLRAVNSALHEAAANARRGPAPQRPAGDDLSLDHVEAAR
jgi:hypothetical protein